MGLGTFLVEFQALHSPVALCSTALCVSLAAHFPDDYVEELRGCNMLLADLAVKPRSWLGSSTIISFDRCNGCI